MEIFFFFFTVGPGNEKMHQMAVLFAYASQQYLTDFNILGENIFFTALYINGRLDSALYIHLNATYIA